MGGCDDFDRFAETQDAPKKELKRNSEIANYVESYTKKTNVTNFGNDRKSVTRFQPPPQGVGRGIKLELFPPAMSSAPFTYEDQATEKEHKMAFFGGVTCLVQDANGAIEPKMGWAVLDS